MSITSQKSEHAQLSLKQRIGCVGTGLITGERTAMTLNPAPADHGIVMRRTDRGSGTGIQLQITDIAVDTKQIRLGRGNRAFTKIDSLLVALAYCGLDNALIEISGPEIPFMDGSGQPFAFLMQCAGIVELEAKRDDNRPTRTAYIDDERGWIRIEPADDTTVIVAGELLSGGARVSRSMVESRCALDWKDVSGLDSRALALPGRVPFIKSDDEPAALNEVTEMADHDLGLFLSLFRLLGAEPSVRIEASGTDPSLLVDALNALASPAQKVAKRASRHN